MRKELSEATLQSLEDFAPEMPPSVEEVRAGMDYTEKGSVRQSIKNTCYVMRNDPNLAGAFRYNLMTERIDVVKALPWKRLGTTFEDMDEAYLFRYVEEAYGLTCDKNIRVALKTVAGDNRYHPVREKLDSLVWDGEPRVRHALHYFLGAEETELNYQLLRHFMLGAIRRAFIPGCKFDEMLCLVGDQGAGKSSFFRFLAMNDDWFSDDMKQLSDKAIFEKIEGKWIVEMSEMNALVNAKGIEEVRSFLSRQRDVYRTPYSVHPKDRKRQVVFAGTSNDYNFLPFDRAGNRRFLPIEVDSKKAVTHVLADQAMSRAYFEQMWAEMMEIYRTGNYETSLPKEYEAQLQEMQRNFMPEDTKAGIVQSFLNGYKGDFVCSMLILEQAFFENVSNVKAWQTKEVNEIMNKEIVGWEKHGQHRFDRYGQQRSWRRKLPPKEPEQMTIGMISEDGFQNVPEDVEPPFD